MTEEISQEERIQALADILSLLAIIGRIDKAAVQRVLISLGSSLFDMQTAPAVNRDMARQLLIEVAQEAGEEAAVHVASDINWVARAWQPVLDEYLPLDPYRLLPYAEVIYALVNYSGVTLQQHEAFDRFGGPDIVLPMDQLAAALSAYSVPQPGLKWELVGFTDPPDQALVASDAQNIYLFKATATNIDLRFSELEREAGDDARREYDVRVDAPLFAAFTAGLLGDMLYWAARLRSHTLPGHEMWQRLQALLTVAEDGRIAAGKPHPRRGRPRKQASA